MPEPRVSDSCPCWKQFFYQSKFLLIYLWLLQRKYFVRFWRISWKCHCPLGKGGFYCLGLPSRPHTLWAGYFGPLFWEVGGQINQQYQRLGSSSSDTENTHAFSSLFLASLRYGYFPRVQPDQDTHPSLHTEPSSPSKDLNSRSQEQDGLALGAPRLTLSKLSSAHLHYVNSSVNQTYYLSPLVSSWERGKQLL